MSASDESFALNEAQSRRGQEFEIEQPALPQADGGKAAWLMLASSCLIQLPVWGILQLLQLKND